MNILLYAYLTKCIAKFFFFFHLYFLHNFLFYFEKMENSFSRSKIHDNKYIKLCNSKKYKLKQKGVQIITAATLELISCIIPYYLA